MRRLGTVDVMLLATVVIWSFNITVTRYVLTHGFGPLSYAAVRYGAAVALFLAITFALERSFAIGGGRSLQLLGIATVTLLINQICFVYALKLTTATTVALILGATPIFTGLVSFAVGLERPSSRFWLATAISFAGVALVAVGSGGKLSSDLGGELLAVALAASWSVYTVAIAPLMRRFSPYRISAVVLLAMWVPLAALAAPQLGEQDYGGLGWLVWLCLGYAIAGPLVLTNVLWFKAIARVGPSRATLVGNLQPFLAAVIAALVLSEELDALQAVGGVAILAAVLLERKGQRLPVPPE